jgi:hypothetical protein
MSLEFLKIIVEVAKYEGESAFFELFKGACSFWTPAFYRMYARPGRRFGRSIGFGDFKTLVPRPGR